MDDRDLFSYDNSGNLEDTGETSFDLNSFSSHTNKPDGNKKKSKKKKKRSHKERIIRTVLTLFLVGLITVEVHVIVVGFVPNSAIEYLSFAICTPFSATVEIRLPLFIAFDNFFILF